MDLLNPYLAALYLLVVDTLFNTYRAWRLVWKLHRTHNHLTLRELSRVYRAIPYLPLARIRYLCCTPMWIILKCTTFETTLNQATPRSKQFVLKHPRYTLLMHLVVRWGVFVLVFYGLLHLRG